MSKARDIADSTKTLDVDGGTIKLDGNYPVGTNNVALGDTALDSLTTGTRNTALGDKAGTGITSGNGNVAVGDNTMTAAVTGADNTAVGTYSLSLNTSGTLNTAVGGSSLERNTTGRDNTAVGRQALAYNTTASQSTAVGQQAGYSTTTGHSVAFLGRNAGFSNTTGVQNTFIGEQSGYYVTTGSKNTILGRYSGNQHGLDLRTSSNNIVLSDGDGNPRLVVNSSAKLGIATTNPTKSLQVGDDPSGTYTKGFTSEDGVQVSSADSTATRYHYRIRNPNGEVGYISTSGSSTTYSTSSDYRLKENVVELSDATTRLKQLLPKRFNFIADVGTDQERTVDGFLAHEVQAIVPEAITGTHNEVDADGNPVYQGIDQSKLVPLLVATIQELEARVTALENA